MTAPNQTNKRQTACAFTLALACLPLTFAHSTFADVIYVPTDYPTIQEAIDASADGDEIVILDGVYTGDGNKNLDFAGRLITVRSENGPDNCIIDCEHSGRGFNFHTGETAAAVVRGLTITNGSVSKGGGGVSCYYSSPTLTDCKITGNKATYDGGGVSCSHASPTLSNCTIVANGALGQYSDGGGIACCWSSTPLLINCLVADNLAHAHGMNGEGGGCFCYDDSSLTMIDCTITGNAAKSDGGGLFCKYDSNPILVNCTIAQNSGHFGAGVCCHDDSNPTISLCTITANSAAWLGGGLYCGAHSNATLANSMITGNEADGHGGALYCGGSSPTLIDCTITANHAKYDCGGVCCFSSSPTLTNCILWNDIPKEIYVYSGNPIVTYCDVQGGYAGQGNISTNPLFTDPATGDYHLSPGSPCIDAADNTAVPADEFDLDDDGDTDEPIPFDLDGNPRFVDDPDTDDTGYGTPPIVDMGCYEYQVGACPADITGDGVVDVLDLLELLGSWGYCPGCPADITGDGVVDVLDLLEVLAAWGACP